MSPSVVRSRPHYRRAVGIGQGHHQRGWWPTQLGWRLLDSGALYRAVGYAAGMEGLDLSDAEAVTRCAQTTKIQFSGSHRWQRNPGDRQWP